MSYLDATAEPLAGLLRPGNAGSGTATDYVEVLDASLTQLPVSPRPTPIIARSDSAGCSATPGALLCRTCPDRDHGPGRDQGRSPPTGPTSAMAPRWPRSPIVPVRLADRDPSHRPKRVHPHPGAQLTFTDSR